jgi:hypothetical protein
VNIEPENKQKENRENASVIEITVLNWVNDRRTKGHLSRFRFWKFELFLFEIIFFLPFLFRDLTFSKFYLSTFFISGYFFRYFTLSRFEQ